MSRLLVTICVIFLVQTHQITISYASSVYKVDAFEIPSDYTTIVAELFDIEKIDLHGNVYALFTDVVSRMKKIVKKLDSMARIYDIETGNLPDPIFESSRTVIQSYNEFKVDLYTQMSGMMYTYDSHDENFLSDTKSKYIKQNRESITKTVEQIISDLKSRSPTTSSSMNGTSICDNNFSLLMTFRHMIVLELKSYLMYTYAVFIQKYISSGCYYHPHANYEYDEYRDVDLMVYSDIYKLLNALFQFSSRTALNGIYECTAGEPIRGEETVEFEGIFQRFIALEPDMNSGKCTGETCPIVPSRRISNDFALEGYHQTKPCRGEVVSCTGGKYARFCYADESSVKRYEGLGFNGEIYGNMNSCPGGESLIHNWIYWFVTCDICLCTCMTTARDTTRTQALSYGEQNSDIESNMVVTNVRFVEKNKAIHIQIEQESLSSLRFSNDSTRRSWKPISNDAVELKQVQKLQRILHLDDVIVPPGYVVTGVKFGPFVPQRGLLDGSYHKFQIRVRATPYDELTNKLTISRDGESTSFWVTPQTMDTSSRPIYKQERTSVYSLNIGEIYDPSLSARNIVDSTPNQYLAFRASDLQVDAGQSTIPFFDSRPAFSKRSFPLIGVGISLKSYGGVNGYLTLKTFPLL